MDVPEHITWVAMFGVDEGFCLGVSIGGYSTTFING